MNTKLLISEQRLAADAIRKLAKQGIFDVYFTRISSMLCY